ncbi:MAG: cob(I)yrinic acid a,c-diamide adenosyltransferase [Chitinivibrionales bacterium]|nr:cob(I)yrinic acid a,c-diamide adenosyltransferase [Chitinivibrionales bacterium]
MPLKKGYIQVYTGEGKGKTTAALGLALRGVAAGYRVFFGQFCKGRLCSEHGGLKKLGAAITVKQFGDKHFIKKITLDQKKCAQKALTEMKAVVSSGAYDLVIFDEVCVAVHLGLIDEKELLECLRGKPEHVEIVCTGRYATPELIRAADLVSEMREIKHYYRSKKIPARKGIEF